jgi:hypothetical protein
VPGVELVALIRREPTKRCTDVLADGDTLTSKEALERRLTREALDEGAELAQAHSSLGSRVAYDGNYFCGESRGERRDGAGRTLLESLMDQRFGPDEDLEPGA